MGGVGEGGKEEDAGTRGERGEEEEEETSNTEHRTLNIESKEETINDQRGNGQRKTSVERSMVTVH